MIENVSTYEVVPDGFNLLDAPPDQLDRYGIPQKPDADAEPSLFEFWKKLVSPPFTSRRPTFSSIDTLTTSTAKISTAPPSKPRSTRKRPSRGMVEWKWNWSGAVVSPPWPKRIVFATAAWIAPNVSRPSVPPLFIHDNIPKSMVWVGIDGSNGRLPKISLPQIGTAHWLDGPFPNFAWWDWWSHSSSSAVTRIDDFAVDAGDEILAGLAVLITGDILFFIKNQSKQGNFRSFLARQPAADIEPLGSSVEWVVERPTEPSSGKLYPLAAHDPVDFKYCLALAADQPEAPGRVMTLAGNGRMIKMREAFADPYRTVYVSCGERRDDPDGSIGVTCTFHEPTEAIEGEAATSEWPPRSKKGTPTRKPTKK